MIFKCNALISPACNSLEEGDKGGNGRERNRDGSHTGDAISRARNRNHDKPPTNRQHGDTSDRFSVPRRTGSSFSHTPRGLSRRASVGANSPRVSSLPFQELPGSLKVEDEFPGFGECPIVVGAGTRLLSAADATVVASGFPGRELQRERERKKERWGRERYAVCRVRQGAGIRRGRG